MSALETLLKRWDQQVSSTISTGSFNKSSNYLTRLLFARLVIEMAQGRAVLLAKMMKMTVRRKMKKTWTTMSSS